MRRFVVVILFLVALAGLAYFIHGANQVGILNGLILNGDAWSDGRHGLSLMVAGGFVVLIALILALGVLLLQIEREISGLRETSDDAQPQLPPAP